MKPVLHSFTYIVSYLREQVADLSAVDMVAQPNGIANHPAWVIGHLTYTCQSLGGVIGLPEWLPSDWSKIFGTGSVPISDVNFYQPKDKLLTMLNDAHLRITLAIEKLDDAQLDQPFPDDSYRDVFPTIRHALTQVLVGHAGFHVGQISVWRRAMGLPSMSRSFE